MGKTEESLKVYDEGIKIFPMNYLLYYNKAVTLQRMGRYQEAIENYQKTLWANPNHRNSHLRLGYLCADEGKYAQAMLSLTTCIMLAPSDTGSLEILSFLNKFLAQKNTLTPKKIILSEGDDFAGLDMIISNHLALNSKYKLKSKIDFPIVRQLQILLENLSYNPNDKGFWMQFYAPTFTEIMKTDRFEPFLYCVLLSSTNASISKVVSKNISKIKSFIEWGSAFWNNSHPYLYLGQLSQREKFSAVRIDNKIRAIGNSDNVNRNTGPWVYYDLNGNVLSKGNFKDGLRQGLWSLYHSNGEKSGEISFVKDKPEGSYAEYNWKGDIIKKTFYKDSLPSQEITFFPSGDTIAITNYKNGKQEGLYRSFYPVRTREYEIPYLQDKISGTARKYFDNGVSEIEAEFKDDQRNGTFREYYKNKVLYNKESYQASKLEGPVKYYYSNGSLKIEAIAHAGKTIKEYKTYYRNGKLMEIYIYDDLGKLNGTYKRFDIDGKLHYEIEYSNDNPIAVRYFNKKNNIIFESKKNKNTLLYKGFYTNGRIEYEGLYRDGNKQGKWTYYDIYGIVNHEENYNEGVLDGPYRYFFQNGKIDRSFVYSNGKMNGPYLEYYANDTVYARGYYVNGRWAGKWESYLPNGSLIYKEYYLEGEKHGWQEIFDITGKLSQETQMGNGKWVKDILYDSLHNIIDTIALKTGTGTYVSHYANQQVLFKSAYMNGQLHGKCAMYFSSGGLEYEGEYFNNNTNGLWKWYDADGKLATEGFYFYGNQDSTWKDYYPNKQVKNTRKYVDGEQSGAFTEFYENGNKKQKGQYRDNEKYGTFEYYSESGDLMYDLYYDHNDVIGYSFLKAGKLVDTLYIDKGNSNMVTYYNNGQKSMECQYSKGWLQGKKTTWYPNGTLCYETNFLNGSINGSAKLYYAEGTLKADENYFWGRLNGECRYFYPNGKTSKTLTYNMDKLHGSSLYFKQDGTLLKTQQYYNGILNSETPNSQK
jgi:antitoxin component YwqK of YwqJK toxin-antitoxin module